MKMDATLIIGLILLGLLAGYLSGLVGIGGGIVMVRSWFYSSDLRNIKRRELRWHF